MDVCDLFEKVSANEVDAVRVALAADPSLAVVRDAALGSTPLHFAAHRGFDELVDALLAAGAPVAAREEASGTTALHWAAEGGHPGVARTLLGRGADPSARDSWFDLTPLGWATVVTWAPRFHHDRPGTAALLRQAGAADDVFTAVVSGRGELLRSLVGPDPSLLARRLGPVGDGMQPLHLAVDRGLHTQVAALLELGADPSARTRWALTPLALAIARGDLEAARLLRARGAKEDVSSAVVAGSADALAALLSDLPDDEGLLTRLLHVAARRGESRVMEVLLCHGADPDARLDDLLGERPAPVSPLHRAAQSGDTEAVRMLLEAGAEASAGAREGVATPLHLAAGSGCVPVVRLLLSHGADAGAVEAGTGATPLGWAEFGGHAGAAELLRPALVP